ncbi:hypothetical protein [Kitasatospora cineracea]|uniref:Uncharacterized protein n=1 Tax=Kitasatospora cineracea TaxID=88074 RepID=A0A3N4RV77_9ACTN|nr:hypothetical protein [Kitasatospora cineracea]ROR46648.1 hypothetical protein EDD39_4932 [Kitasatospora cineracea]RPE36816.1 hypothetical protein EDD38_5197 [Kitasatospora cineracea]
MIDGSAKGHLPGRLRRDRETLLRRQASDGSDLWAAGHEIRDRITEQSLERLSA